MKTLIINGSPRKNGNTSYIIKEMSKYLEGEVNVVNAYNDNINPCIDCRFCWTNDRCKIEDEMQNVYKHIYEADNVIIASPLNFSEITGKLLSLVSRFQLFYVSKYIRKDQTFKLKKKNAVIILTGGGDGSHETALKTTTLITKHINAQLIGTILSLHTDKLPAQKDIDALNESKRLALKLNDLHNISIHHLEDYK